MYSCSSLVVYSQQYPAGLLDVTARIAGPDRSA
jgi:hypothetical protein